MSKCSTTKDWLHMPCQGQGAAGPSCYSGVLSMEITRDTFGAKFLWDVGLYLLVVATVVPDSADISIWTTAPCYLLGMGHGFD